MLDKFLTIVFRCLAFYFAGLIFLLCVAGGISVISFLVVGIEALLEYEFAIGLALLLLIAPITLMLSVICGKISNLLLKMVWGE